MLSVYVSQVCHLKKQHNLLKAKVTIKFSKNRKQFFFWQNEARGADWTKSSSVRKCNFLQLFIFSAKIPHNWRFSGHEGHVKRLLRAAGRERVLLLWKNIISLNARWFPSPKASQAPRAGAKKHYKLMVNHPSSVVSQSSACNSSNISLSSVNHQPIIRQSSAINH